MRTIRRRARIRRTARRINYYLEGRARRRRHRVDPRCAESGRADAQRRRRRRGSTASTGTCATSRRQRCGCARARSTRRTCRSAPTARGPAAGGRLSILPPPGTYTVRLNVGGKQLTQKLEVRKDPELGRHRGRHPGADEDALRAAARHRRAADLVNQIELVRSQIDRPRSGARRIAEIMKPARELDQKLIDDRAEPRRAAGDRPRPGRRALRLAAARQARTIWPTVWRARDFRPTNQQLEVQKVLEEQLRKHQAALDGLVGKELKTLNELMRGRVFPNIIIRRSWHVKSTSACPSFRYKVHG